MPSLTHVRRWRWQGLDADGQRREGELLAPGEAAARRMLRDQRVTITHLHPGRRHAPAGRVASADATDLVRRLSTLLGAGVPLAAALDVLARGAHARGLKRLASAIGSDVALGYPLAQAMARASRRFSHIDCQLIAAGELSGQLGPTLARLSAQYDHTRTVKEKLQRALAYPLTVLAVATTVVVALLQWVIPEFERLFASAAGGGVPLPPLTRWLIDLSRASLTHGPWLLAGMGASGLVITAAWRRSTRIRRLWDRLILRLPGVGRILRMMSAARWSRTLGTLLDAGVALPDAMDAAASACGNLVMQQAAHDVHRAVARGSRLATSLEAHAHWPLVIAQLTVIGEESGTLGRMLNQAAGLLDEEASHALVSACATLEPMMITFLGLLIGGMVLAMYLPMFQLGYGVA
ncbi:type II secretion system F family protein [Pandoraea fibrosis]|uniref:Type II secretion system F family protein n=1 Tax=Pandoraea fibrosis TaxID=1891094 RepID=A0ABX6HN41_9BURK|nr:type II secretion system F family protein [Pandoraea fibrosis]QHE94131.1 type II secretion system F family protein [Pandoraea fibrosis]QHF12305.1 type II secretion system F family protein [Pandoraea fibrosis]